MGADLAINLPPAPGAGAWRRIMAWLRGRFSRRALLKLTGVRTVTLEGHVYAVRAVPLGVARDLVPAVLRASRKFAAWEIDDDLYADMITVLSLGLAESPRKIENLSVPLWQLAPVIDCIARANGLPVLEAGSDVGKLLATLTTSTGTASTPPSSAPPDGHGSTSINA